MRKITEEGMREKVIQLDGNAYYTSSSKSASFDYEDDAIEFECFLKLNGEFPDRPYLGNKCWIVKF